MRILMAMVIYVLSMSSSYAVYPVIPFTEPPVKQNTVCYLDPDQRIIYIDCNETDGILHDISLWDDEGNLVYKEEHITLTNNGIYELRLNQLEQEWFFMEINTMTNISWHEITIKVPPSGTRI